MYADGIKMEHKTRINMYTDLENDIWLFITDSKYPTKNSNEPKSDHCRLNVYSCHNVRVAHSEFDRYEPPRELLLEHQMKTRTNIHGTHNRAVKERNRNCDLMCLSMQLKCFPSYKRWLHYQTTSYVSYR